MSSTPHNTDRDSSTGIEPHGLPDVRKKVSILFYIACGSGLLFVALAAVGYCGWRSVFTSLLWALACFAVGTLLGFMFCLPKTTLEKPRENQNDEHEKDRGLGTVPNNSLIEIADWLTKIIVGLGLVNLTKIPGHLRSLASFLAEDLNTCGEILPYQAFSMALIVAFATLGFLFGYLSMRLFLWGALVRADVDAFDAARRKADAADQKAEAAGGAIESVQDQMKAVNQVISELRAFDAVATQEQVKTNTDEEGGEGSAIEAEIQRPVIERIMQLADEYVNFRSSSYQERFQTKDKLARSIAILINGDPQARSSVLERNTAQHNNGLVAGYADAVNTQPQSGDFDKLIRMAKGQVQDNHTMYRIATAIGRLFEEGLATKEDARVAVSVLEKFRPASARDNHLLERLTRTYAQIKTAKSYNLGDTQ